MSRRGANRDEARADVLARAAIVIAEQGYHGMSMRDLAKATGRALASFYHLFGSKEEILFELQERAFQQLLASAVAATQAPGTGTERLRRFIANHVHFFVAEPAVMRVLVQEASTLPPEARSVIRALKQRYFALGEALLTAVAAQGGGDPLPALEVERATYCMFGMLNWIYGWYEPPQHGTPDELAQTIFDMTVSGIAGRAAKPAHLTLVRPPHPARRGRP